jgi:FtsP/CotA-like multicopper oxidase with cupredoxin domain
MLAYNGSIPGPLLRVAQGSDITVAVTNNAGREQTVHWHGLRLDNHNDGVPDQTQHPIPVFGVFTYRLRFPDPGLYWYHPQVRQNDGQEIGLYGQIIVDPTGPDDRPPVNREIPLTLNKILIAEDQLPAVHRSWPRHTTMGHDRTASTILLANARRPAAGPAGAGHSAAAASPWVTRR